ncbi:MAG: SPOR domain-containing protein [Magnetococcales bacterium]|nr:SPOR domain-containing protein [Magnetococcales bacterium]
MNSMKSVVKKSLGAVSLLLLAAGCAPHPELGAPINHHDSLERTLVNTNANTEFHIKMDVGSFCRAGDYWGANLRNDTGNLYGKKPLNTDFVHFLRTGEMDAKAQTTPMGRFYFGVNQELRAKFHSCFRTTFGRMDADDVLGYHVSTAAGEIGREIGAGFAQWPKKFFQLNLERSNSFQGKFDPMLKETNSHAVAMLELFQELLTSGSPADRQAFKTGFVCSYRDAMKQTLAEIAKEMPAVSQKNIPVSEDLSQSVVCANSAMTGYELTYNRTENFMTTALEGQFYANHTTTLTDNDKLAFRIFAAEEIYLRNYRRALHAAGVNLGNALFHGLKDRNDGVEYLRNLSIAVDKPGDIQLYLAPGFRESFEHGGETYLNDMLAQLNLSKAAPQKAAAKPAAAKPAAAKPAANKTSQVQDSAPVVSKVETKAPESQPVSAALGTESKAGGCFVHIGSFSKESSVTEAKNQLKSKGIDNVSQRPVTAKPNTPELMQVRVGPFASKTTALTERNRIAGSYAGSIGGVLCDI